MNQFMHYLTLSFVLVLATWDAISGRQDGRRAARAITRWRLAKEFPVLSPVEIETKLDELIEPPKD
jgi:hypothetical protein